MLKSVNGFILAKYCRWSHTDKKKEKKKRMSLFLSFSMYICVMMTIADVFVGSVFVVYSPCHTFMTSKKKKHRCHHVAFYHLSISFCKVYILIMVMILSRADSSLSVSVCHSRNGVFEFVST